MKTRLYATPAVKGLKVWAVDGYVRFFRSVFFPTIGLQIISILYVHSSYFIADFDVGHIIASWTPYLLYTCTYIFMTNKSVETFIFYVNKISVCLCHTHCTVSLLQCVLSHIVLHVLVSEGGLCVSFFILNLFCSQIINLFILCSYIP